MGEGKGYFWYLYETFSLHLWEIQLFYFYILCFTGNKETLLAFITFFLFVLISFIDTAFLASLQNTCATAKTKISPLRSPFPVSEKKPIKKPNKNRIISEADIKTGGYGEKGLGTHTQKPTLLQGAAHAPQSCLEGGRPYNKSLFMAATASLSRFLTETKLNIKKRTNYRTQLNKKKTSATTY